MIEESPGDAPEPPHVRSVVADAIQELMASRLGRGFIPLALLFGVGGAGFVRSSGTGLSTALGAVGASAAMLVYGLRVVQRTADRSHRPWMSLAMLASVVPPVYAVYVLGWIGLRGLTSGHGAGGVVTAILHVALGVWVLRAWMSIVELERLARIMSMNLDGDGESV